MVLIERKYLALKLNDSFVRNLHNVTLLVPGVILYINGGNVSQILMIFLS
jgi:hypothetical protein